KSALLVRLRRTKDLQGQPRNALDEEAGVSSAANALPLLFGRGSLIKGDPGTGYAPRHDGITVRATAIAFGRPALCVGATNAAFNLKGMPPFGLNLDFWNALSVDQSVTAMIDSTGEIV